jgi:Domain of unknown function (DUF4253)
VWGRGSIAFAEDAGGGLVVEVATREQLPGLVDRRSTEVPFDPERHGRARLDVTGVPEHKGEWGDLPPGWRYIAVQAQVAKRPYVELTRWLDLSEGAAERRLASSVLESGLVWFRWVNEGVEVLVELVEPCRTTWAEALQATRGVTREAWRAEMLERDWGRCLHSWSHPAFPRDHSRRVGEPPTAGVPFFARVSGAIPPEGSPSIAGLKLPPGNRCGCFRPAYWATYDDVDGASALASRLAAAFPDTGLWPVGWGWDQEDPDSYFEGHPDVDAIGTSEPSDVLRVEWERWERLPELSALFGLPFPRLAAASLASPSRAPDTFRVLDRPLPWGTAGRRLLLVPCNRPADALSVLGMRGTKLDTADRRAILRSWEERFSVVPVDLSPSLVTFAVGAPPTSRDQALCLAAEMCAITATDECFDRGGIEVLARRLMPGEFDDESWWDRIGLTSRFWRLNLDE